MRGKAARRGGGRLKVCRQLLRTATSRLPAVMLSRGPGSRKFFSWTLTRYEAGGDSLLLLAVGTLESVWTDSSRPSRRRYYEHSLPPLRTRVACDWMTRTRGLVRVMRSIIIRHVAPPSSGSESGIRVRAAATMADCKRQSSIKSETNVKNVIRRDVLDRHFLLFAIIS